MGHVPRCQNEGAKNENFVCRFFSHLYLHGIVKSHFIVSHFIKVFSLKIIALSETCQIKSIEEYEDSIENKGNYFPKDPV